MTQSRSKQERADDSVPLIKYEPIPLPVKAITRWIGLTLESGAEVRVGLQTGHPHGGIGLVHDMRNTQPDTGGRTRLVFCITPEAAAALVALYVAHGIQDRLDNLTKWHRVEDGLPPCDANKPPSYGWLVYDGSAIWIECSHPGNWNYVDESDVDFNGPVVTHWRNVPDGPDEKGGRG